MTVEIRTLADGEYTAYLDALLGVFGNDAAEADPDGVHRLRALIEREQTWAAFDGSAIVGTAATFKHAIRVPGGTLPIAGLTMVTVRPTHRRRGILRGLMTRHLDDARERGYAASGLWASESSIYGRFGYGIAAENDAIAIERASTLTMPARELDRIEWADEPRAREVLPAIYARATADRPGALVRSPTWWHERRFLEIPFVRAGASKRRHALARRGDELVGYVQYRQRPGFDSGLPSGRTVVVELIAIDARAAATLWQFVLQIDLFPTVTWGNAPTDDPLAWMVDDPRRVQRTRADNLWLRIEDVPGALAARTYPRDGRLCLRVDATTCELVVEGGRARCAVTAREPQITLARANLGSLYLGCVTASVLAQADRLHGEPAAIALADQMFASARAPWCPEVF